MYDCQTDACTDFSFSFVDIVGCAKALFGILTATPATPDDRADLAELASHAQTLGYTSKLDGDSLTVYDMTLYDALAINTRFGASLIICCDLRRTSPVRFG